MSSIEKDLEQLEKLKISTDSNEKLFILLKNITKNAFLPQVKNNDLQPIVKKDIESFENVIEDSFQLLNQILETIINKEIMLEIDILIQILLLCGEHQEIKFQTETFKTYNQICKTDWIKQSNKLMNTSNVWISEQTQQLSNEILNKISIITKRPLKETLSKYNERCFTILNEKLKNNWLDYLASVNCYIWILFNTELSEISTSNYLNILFKILDHHSSEHKLKAINCFLHILNNNKQGVNSLICIEKQLINILYHTDIEMIIPTTLCIIKLAEANKRNQIIDFNWTSIDEVVLIIIPSIETGNSEVQCANIDALAILTDFTQLAIIKWNFSIMNIIQKSIPNTNVYSHILNLCQIYLINIWPFVSKMSEELCNYLFKMLISCTERNHKQEIYKCYYLIKRGADNSKSFNDFLNRVQNEVKNDAITELISFEFGENFQKEFDHFHLFDE